MNPADDAMQASVVHLVDGSLYVCRAWFGQPPDVRDADGEPAHAVHGFTRFLLDLLESARPTHLAVAFDEALASCFRNALYPEYKANRPPAPADLKRQFGGCREVADALGLATLGDTRYEADDLIGSVLTALRERGFRCVIVSADKDFGQLIGANDELWDPPRNQRWNSAGIKARLGVRPHQVADFLALTGDTSDNIPGVPGVGAKTAAILLQLYGTLEAVLERSEEVAFLRLRGAASVSRKLREHAAQARLSRSLTGIALDAPVPTAADHYRRQAREPAHLDALCERWRFGPLTRARLRALAGN
ncbi:5'-3' exonuclease [Dokdonella sp.]|uniref:5'-3' exonuclease n=1 Tax=Dokdonella sp. TaxID=2291710 RepID=UPI0031BD6DD6|nr:exodeoxyribonuclease IX [Dokdonella sp.]